MSWGSSGQLCSAKLTISIQVKEAQQPDAWIKLKLLKSIALASILPWITINIVYIYPFCLYEMTRGMKETCACPWAVEHNND